MKIKTIMFIVLGVFLSACSFGGDGANESQVFEDSELGEPLQAPRSGSVSTPNAMVSYIFYPSDLSVGFVTSDETVITESLRRQGNVILVSEDNLVEGQNYLINRVGINESDISILG